MRLAKFDIRDFGQEILTSKAKNVSVKFKDLRRTRTAQLDQNSSLRGESYNSRALVDEF